MNQRRLWIVEDDPRLAVIMHRELERFGWQVTRAENWSGLVEECRVVKPAVVVLDLNLPVYDGFYWCRRLRTVTSAPILFLSARSDALDQVRALEQGGDDYLTKPVHPDLLRTKLEILWRRATGAVPAPAELHGADWTLDTARGDLRRGADHVILTRTESALLEALVAAEGAAVSRDRLLSAIWDDEMFIEDNTLTVTIGRLRAKMAAIGMPDAIGTVRGLGYSLRQDDPPDSASHLDSPS